MRLEVMVTTLQCLSCLVWCHTHAKRHDTLQQKGTLKILDIMDGLVTQSQFKGVYLVKYYLVRVRPKNQVVFLKSKQGVRTVKEYDLVSTILTRIALELVSTEMIRMDHFITDFTDEIQDLRLLRLSRVNKNHFVMIGTWTCTLRLIKITL